MPSGSEGIYIGPSGPNPRGPKLPAGREGVAVGGKPKKPKKVDDYGLNVIPSQRSKTGRAKTPARVARLKSKLGRSFKGAKPHIYYKAGGKHAG